MIGDLLQAPLLRRGIAAGARGRRLEGRVIERPSVSDETGQGLVEYSLVILLIVLLAIPALDIIGVSVIDFLTDAGNQI